LEILKSSLLEKSPTSKIDASDKIDDIINADLILVVTNTPGAIVRSKHLKSGAIVIDAAQPRNVSAKVPCEREDVIVIESGIAEVDGLHVNCDFGLKKENEVYSCFAELLLLCWMNEYDEDHVDPIKEDYVLKLWEVADKAGIKIADFRNITGFVDESKFTELYKHMRGDKNISHA
jgi:predicted amino acid dehydrogenase